MERFPGNMQEFGFIQAIGKTPEEFWKISDGIARGQDASNVLSYMKLMLDEASKSGIKLRRSDFRKFGAHIRLFEGVKEWFRIVNEYGEAHGVKIEHYINSSGLKEIIEGSPIAGAFKHIFACTFLYDENGEAEWPGIAVDYTAKPVHLQDQQGNLQRAGQQEGQRKRRGRQKADSLPADDLLRGR